MTLLFVPSLAMYIKRSESATRRAVLRGDLGPYLRIGRRLAVRKAALLEALKGREKGAK